ncbi:MAG: hypothetical protein ILP10_06105, partial [Lachnospiraceae bacterium]|nr:hypothetical protein [Lachnospiraceae bacterium]
MKKRITIAAFLVLALLVGAFAPARAEAATKKEKAYAAYYEAIEYIRDPESPAGGFEKFKLIYVNSDSIPELLAVHV